MLSCGLRFAVECLYELCPGFSMPDETVETRHPWLDFSLPRRPCLGISVLYSIILQTLNSCAIRPPYSTACLHPGILSAFMWEAQNLQLLPTHIIALRSFANVFFSIRDMATWLRPSTSATCFCVLSCI